MIETSPSKQLRKIFDLAKEALERPTVETYRKASDGLADLSHSFTYVYGYFVGLNEAKNMAKEITKEEKKNDEQG